MERRSWNPLGVLPLLAVSLLLISSCAPQAAPTPTPAPLLATPTVAAKPSPTLASPTPVSSPTPLATPVTTPTTAALATSVATPTVSAGATVTATASAAVGQQLFQTNCVVCHGASGAGGISVGGTTSADLRQSALAPGYDQNVALLERAILDGQDEDGKDLETAMPRWRGRLTQQQVDNIIAYLFTLK